MPSDMSEASAPPRIDLLLPPETAAACEDVGVRKAAMDVVSMAVLAGLAGAFIGLGAMFYTVTTTDSELGFGATRVLGGLVFSLGLILVILAGAELFTGNTLVVMAWANRKVSTVSLLRGWAIVYVGNFVGALLTVLLVQASGQWQLAGHAVGARSLDIAVAKVHIGFGEAVVLGILCNVLVTLAVWLSLAARDFTGKVLAIIFPITAFVAAGFEHSVANMYFVPLGIFLKDEEAVVASASSSASAIDDLTWLEFLGGNLLPVTIGNIIGGAVLVGLVYWFVYLRKSPTARFRIGRPR